MTSEGRETLSKGIALEGGRDVIRLLGRQTSGNVQKVIFCLEELGVPYIREDYGRQFGNTLTDEYRKLNILDGHLAGRNWFALNRFTIADIALGPIVKRCLEFPIERPVYSELERWQTAIGARPAFAVAIGAKPSALTSAA